MFYWYRRFSVRIETQFWYPYQTLIYLFTSIDIEISFHIVKWTNCQLLALQFPKLQKIFEIIKLGQNYCTSNTMPSEISNLSTWNLVIQIRTRCNTQQYLDSTVIIEKTLILMKQYKSLLKYIHVLMQAVHPGDYCIWTYAKYQWQLFVWIFCCKHSLLLHDMYLPSWVL